MKKRDHYIVLGVNPAASADQIRRAYLERARRCHPDSGGDDASHDRFVELQDAYDCLSDSDNRRRYDAERALSAARAADLARVLREDGIGRPRGSSGRPVPDEPWQTLADIFTGLGFERLARPANGPRPELTVEVTVSEADARRGSDVTIRVPRGPDTIQPVTVRLPPFEGRQTVLERTIADRRHGGLNLTIRVRVR